MYQNIQSPDLCRICLGVEGTNDIFKTTITGDLVANLLIDLADIEVSCLSIFLLGPRLPPSLNILLCP
jgi:hypothetical protein